MFPVLSCPCIFSFCCHKSILSTIMHLIWCSFICRKAIDFMICYFTKLSLCLYYFFFIYLFIFKIGLIWAESILKKYPTIHITFSIFTLIDFFNHLFFINGDVHTISLFDFNYMKDFINKFPNIKSPLLS